MAEKKTTRKVLSDRALELVMLNVLGGLVCGMQDALEPVDKIKDEGAVRQGNSSPTEAAAEHSDHKLNS
jgi:hypothetical protein